MKESREIGQGQWPKWMIICHILLTQNPFTRR